MFLLRISIVSARKNCSQKTSMALNTASIEMSSDLRKCQNDAITTFDVRRSEGEPRTNLSLCTGSGKTRIIQEISQTGRRIIIVFPWLTLLKQFWDDHNNPFKKYKCVRYLATEGTIEGVNRLDTKMDELDASDYVILTTYTSAPRGLS
jgi:superfamily II DNA or RNA helicase